MDRFFTWDKHQHVLAAIIFAGLLCIMLPENDLLPSLIAAAIATIPLMFVLFVPYLLIVTAAALLLALPQAIATALRHPDQAAHSSPIR